jgi:2,3-bisphosphoglycerate-dependent phosphoglycerate mutase
VDCAHKWGKEQVQLWRRSYEHAPPQGESLKELVARVVPYFKEKITPYLKENRNVLIASHGSPLRAILMTLEQWHPEEVARLEITTGEPIIFEVDGAAIKRERG